MRLSGRGGFAAESDGGGAVSTMQACRQERKGEGKMGASPPESALLFKKVPNWLFI